MLFKTRQKDGQFDQSHCIVMCSHILTFQELFQVPQDQSSIRLYKFECQNQQIQFLFRRLLKLVLMEFQDSDGKFIKRS